MRKRLSCWRSRNGFFIDQDIDSTQTWHIQTWVPHQTLSLPANTAQSHLISTLRGERWQYETKNIRGMRYTKQQMCPK